MKLSASNIAWHAEDDVTVYQRLKALGFSGVEIAPTRWVQDAPYSAQGIATASSIARALNSDWGLSVSSMQSLWFGKNQQLFGTVEERDYLQTYTEQALDFAAAVGCAHVVFGSPKNRVSHSDSDAVVGEAFFTACAKHAAKAAVVIGMEANPAVYGTNYINFTSEAAALVKAVNQPFFKLNLDLGTVLINGESIESIAEVLPLVSHVHISEPMLAPVGERDLHHELAKLLQAQNYQGWVSLEMKNEGLDPLFGSLEVLAKVFL